MSLPGFEFVRRLVEMPDGGLHVEHSEGEQRPAVDVQRQNLDRLRSQRVAHVLQYLKSQQGS